MWLSNFFHAVMNQLTLIRITDVIDILIVSFLVYKALKFIRDTRTAQLLKGVLLLVVLTAVSGFAKLNTLNYILSNVLQVGLLAILIVFQPELRRALERVGRTSMSRWFDRDGTFWKKTETVIHEVARGAQAMANTRTGALIVIEKHDKIDELISSGITLHATTSSELLENIFVPNTPLHDGAVVIRDDKIEFASCVLPLSENPNIRQELGTRHRAGLGISEESDAVVVIVSEETGNISVAYGGVLQTGYGEESLRGRLSELLHDEEQNDVKKKFPFSGFGKKGEDE